MRYAIGPDSSSALSEYDPTFPTKVFENSDTAGALARVLPFIEAANVAMGKDFSQITTGYFKSAANPYYNDIKGIKLACILCPSSGDNYVDHEIQGGWAPGNYVVCVGSGTGENSVLSSSKTDGVFYRANNNGNIATKTYDKTNGDHGFEGLMDGTSNTMILSEALVYAHALNGAPINAKVCNRLTLNTNDPLTDRADPDLIAATAAIATTGITGKQNRCESWLSSRWDHSVYNAYLTPNQSNACGFGSINFAPSSGVRRGIFKATSSHTAGVNAAYGDGSVHFVTDNISREIWIGLSTTNGGEPTSY
jgi:hypothetical protein